MSHGSDFKSLAWGAVLLLLAACVPLVANGYWMSIALTIAMFTVLATSWSLFSGPTHYISLATAAFSGGGAIWSAPACPITIWASGRWWSLRHLSARFSPS